MNINANTNGYILANLYNVSTSTEVPNSLFQIVSVVNITGNIGCNTTKNMIIENIPAGTIYKIRALRSGTSSTIYNNSTNGYTYLSYKMLGITTNVPLTNRWGTVGTLPITITFDDYTLLFESVSSLKIKKTTATTLYAGGLLTYSTMQVYYTTYTLAANTYSTIFFSGSSNPGIAGMYFTGGFTDETKTYNIQIMTISATKQSITIQSLI